MATKLCIQTSWDIFELCKGAICLDIGANNGGMTRGMLDSGATKVYCIEPGAANVKIMQERYANDSRVVIYKIGCSDEKKILRNVTWLNAWLIGDPTTISYPVSPGACDVEGYALVDIELDTVDNLFKDTPEEIAFIKIDVDGYDYKVLTGAIQLINRCRPVIYIELSCYYETVEPGSVQRFIDFVVTNKYIFIDLAGHICSPEYISAEFPHHSSCDVFLCPSEKIDLFNNRIVNPAT